MNRIFDVFINNVSLHDLKGQSHRKVGEMRVQGDSLGPN
jgi:hypothetical protein